MIRIGTSGWSYPHWRGIFYPKGVSTDGMLSFYAGRFDAVEINATHYRLPPSAVFDGWRAAVPQGFLFAVKASRYLTHFYRLKPPFDRYERFFDGVARLGGALGPVLFQLPPRFGRDDERIVAFLAALPKGFLPVLEFRHLSWETPEVAAILERHGAGLCVTDLAGHQSPLAATGAVAYVRLHGPYRAYTGSYDDAALVRWARQARSWEAEGRAVYVFFDNDDKAMAVGDAERLKGLVQQRAA